ncbi:hypothetical protein SAMN05421543_10775 [Alicyclobacillus macrosporangiidus]|uniref:Uncharacterized protein n=1 Tax=Alicyclobacillus macrosporangiidus TaxID=392015 RepID=A0A1I7IS32_9BACL|nr:hypothetical protein SAMN05421543_10775 [Alicyclobacillus macrosporangiidus]
MGRIAMAVGGMARGRAGKRARRDPRHRLGRGVRMQTAATDGLRRRVRGPRPSRRAVLPRRQGQRPGRLLPQRRNGETGRRAGRPPLGWKRAAWVTRAPRRGFALGWIVPIGQVRIGMDAARTATEGIAAAAHTSAMEEIAAATTAMDGPRARAAGTRPHRAGVPAWTAARAAAMTATETPAGGPPAGGPAVVRADPAGTAVLAAASAALAGLAAGAGPAVSRKAGIAAHAGISAVASAEPAVAAGRAALAVAPAGGLPRWPRNR